MELYDITEDIRRVTQLVYLLIKCRDRDNKLRPVTDVQQYIKIVKTINYDELVALGADTNPVRNARP
jgi:hypothetical protein